LRLDPGRHRRDSHRHATWIAKGAAALARLYQHHRECHGHSAARLPEREAMALGRDGDALDRGRYAGSSQRLPKIEGSQAASSITCCTGGSPNQKLTWRPCSPCQRRLTSTLAATASQCSTNSGTSPMDAERRLKRVEEQISGLLPEWNLRPVVDALQAMRGIALINAVVLVAAVGDFTRFTNPRQLMAYFGLVPGEQSSGETIRRGGITKTGNAHARRALVEGAWAYRMKARIGRHKVDRIEALPKIIRDIGWKAQVRLCTRYRRLRARGKTANVVNVAIARDMVGFIWSIACTIQSTPKT